jgi:RNA polymerase sigma factor (sigma-70 family)
MAVTAQVDAGHNDAARSLYERYYPNVYRFALSHLRSPEDAEDAAQNTFLRAYRALQRGVVPENESAWLFKIAHNVCTSSKLAWLRRRRVETPDDVHALPVAALERNHDELAGLGDALAEMPPRLREAFLLREWQGLSYDEIAERLDTSRSAVETLIFRARRMLAQRLDQPWQRVKQALGLGPLLNTIRSLFDQASLAMKAGAAALLIAGGTVAVAQPSAHKHAKLRPDVPALGTRVALPALLSVQTASATATPAASDAASRKRTAAAPGKPVAGLPAPEPTFPPPAPEPTFPPPAPEPSFPPPSPDPVPPTPTPDPTPVPQPPQVPPLPSPSPLPDPTPPQLPPTGVVVPPVPTGPPVPAPTIEPPTVTPPPLPKVDVPQPAPPAPNLAVPGLP